MNKKLLSLALAGAICVTGILGASTTKVNAASNNIAIEQNAESRMSVININANAGQKFITLRASAVPAGVSIKVKHQQGMRIDTYYGTMPSGAGSVTHKVNINKTLAKGDYISVEYRNEISGYTVK